MLDNILTWTAICNKEENNNVKGSFDVTVAKFTQVRKLLYKKLSHSLHSILTSFSNTNIPRWSWALPHSIIRTKTPSGCSPCSLRSTQLHVHPAPSNGQSHVPRALLYAAPPQPRHCLVSHWLSLNTQIILSPHCLCSQLLLDNFAPAPLCLLSFSFLKYFAKYFPGQWQNDDNFLRLD